MNTRRSPRPSRSILVACAIAAVSTVPASCGGSGADSTLTIVAYDAFTPAEGIFDEFTAATGYEVEVVTGGDSGTVVSRAILTAGNPEGDVLWGVDNTLLSRARDADVLEDYEPVDYGDVCVNVDDEWFASRGIAPPRTLEDLAEPAYDGLLVVQDPTASSPGLAFMLATVARFGDGWRDYWRRLRDNDVTVAPDWTTAYTVEFSGSSGRGPRPLVVSYGSSPPAEVVFSETPRESPPTSVMSDTCFRQTEYVGVLRGTDSPEPARLLVDFLLGVTFQESMPLSLFVFPTNPEAVLPEVFERFAVRADGPLSLDPQDIADNRERWLDEWTAVMS